MLLPGQFVYYNSKFNLTLSEQRGYPFFLSWPHPVEEDRLGSWFSPLGLCRIRSILYRAPTLTQSHLNHTAHLQSFSRCVGIKLLKTNWVLTTCPGVLGADKELSPTVPGLCSALENHLWQLCRSPLLSVRFPHCLPQVLALVFALWDLSVKAMWLAVSRNPMYCFQRRAWPIFDHRFSSVRG